MRNGMQTIQCVARSVFILFLFNNVAYGFSMELPIYHITAEEQPKKIIKEEWRSMELSWHSSLKGQELGKILKGQHLLLAKGPFGKPREEEQALSFPKSRSQRDTPGGSIAPNHSGGRPSPDGTGRDLKDGDLRTEKLPEPGDMPPPPLPDPSGKMPVLGQPIP